MRQLVALMIGVLALPACSPNRTMVVENPRIPEPAGANAALYLNITNKTGRDDTLIGVMTNAAPRAMIHQTKNEDGLMTMEAVPELQVLAGETIVLDPGGLHIMLRDVAPLTAGDEVSVDLMFSEAGTVSFVAPVVEIVEAAG